MTVAKRRTIRGKEVVRRFWEQAFNNADPEVVDEYISNQFKLVDLSTGHRMNRKNVKDMIEGLREHVNKPEVEIVQQMRAEHDRIVSQLIFQALPFSDYESTEPVKINVITIDRIENAQVVETTLMWDAWTANETLRPDPSGKLEWRFPWW